MAPYAEKEKRVRHFLEGFIHETWRLYVARPKEPVYTMILLELPDTSIGDKEVVMPGFSGGHYEESSESASSLAYQLIQLKSRGDENERILEFPKIILGVTKSAVEELPDRILRSIYRITRNTNSLFFLNRNSKIHSVYKHISYTSEHPKIVSDESDDRGVGSLLFATLNVPSLATEAHAQSRPFDLSDLPSLLESYIHTLVNVAIRKRDSIKDQLTSRDLSVLSCLDSISSKPYYKLEDCTINLGVFGLSEILQTFGLNMEENSSDLFDVLIKLNERISELEEAYEIRILLTQAPFLYSHVYKHLLGVDTPPLDYANLTPTSISDNKKRLEIERRLHEILAGGTISRVCITAKEYSDFEKDPSAFKDRIIETMNEDLPFF